MGSKRSPLPSKKDDSSWSMKFTTFAKIADQINVYRQQYPSCRNLSLSGVRGYGALYCQRLRSSPSNYRLRSPLRRLRKTRQAVACFQSDQSTAQPLAGSAAMVLSSEKRTLECFCSSFFVCLGKGLRKQKQRALGIHSPLEHS